MALSTALITLGYPFLALMAFACARACLYDLACSQSWGAVVRASPGFSRCYFDFTGADQSPPGASLIFHVNWFHGKTVCPNIRDLGNRLMDMLFFWRSYRGADQSLAIRLGLTIYSAFVVATMLGAILGCLLGTLACRVLYRPSYWSERHRSAYRRLLSWSAARRSAVLACPSSIVMSVLLLMLFPSEHYNALPGIVSPSWFGLGVLLLVPGLLVVPLTLRLHARQIGREVKSPESLCVCDYPCAPAARCPECGRTVPGFPPRVFWRWRLDDPVNDP